MQYRNFGKLDWKGSALGFGAMRLPQLDRNPESVDEPESIRMIRYAIDHGVNYVDTAYPYHGGRSEVAVGKALQDGYREKVKLATKLPVWFTTSFDDCDRYLNEQLERLQTDKIDFYLIHGLNKEQWPKMRDMDVFKWAESAMKDGRIQYLGFSFYDNFELFKEIVDAYDNWALAQIQYNYMDTEYQAGTKGLQYAAEKGIAVVIMEPLRGGRLSKEPPKQVAELWETAPKERSPADWALQWVWNQPEVSVVLSGMSAMQHVIENVESAEQSGVGILKDEDLAFIDTVCEAYQGMSPIPCTSCGYCMPCPNDVEISRIFELYNDAIMYEEPRTPRYLYRGPTGLKEEQRADQCVECGECEEACPQDIPVAEWLKKVHEMLGPRK